MKISIVVPVLSNFKGAVDMFESVNTVHDWEPIVIPQYRRNRALANAWNTGIEKGLSRGSKYVLVANDDILFAPFTIDRVINFMESGPDNLILLSACNDRGYVDNNFGRPEGVFDLDPNVYSSDGFRENPDFSCFLVDERLFERVGRFDENFVPAYWEDNDMHYRINISGNTAGCISSAPYYHYGSQTEKDVAFHKSFEANRTYYKKKWGALPEGHGEKELWVNPYNDPNMTLKDWL